MSEITVPFDASRMQRAIENLISNASEAMVGKGQDVKISANACPLITIESRFTPRGAEISVTDNGPGMAPEVLGRVLEPLFTTKSFGTAWACQPWRMSWNATAADWTLSRNSERVPVLLFGCRLKQWPSNQIRA